jgi:predicted DNA-binding protein
MKTTQFTLTDEQHRRLKEEARKRGATQADTMRALIEEHLPPVREELRTPTDTGPQALGIG